MAHVPRARAADFLDSRAVVVLAPILGRLTPWLAIAAIAGDLIYFSLRAEPSALVGPGFVVAGGLLAWRRISLVLNAVALSLLFFGIGFSAAQVAARRAPPFPPIPFHAVELQGRIDQREFLPSGERLLLDRVTLDGVGFGSRTVRLKLVDAPAELRPGAVVRVRARLFPPDPPAMPGGRDPQREAFFAGLGGSGYALDPVQVVRQARATMLQRLRDRIATRLRAVMKFPQSAVAATLLTGQSGAIPDEDRAAFRDAGLSHLLAIAGLHIAIVMGLITLATRAVLLRFERIALAWPVRQIAAFAGLVGGLGYLLLTGGHLPTLRSLIMAGLIVLGLLAGRRALSWRSWGLAAIAAVVLDPSAVTLPSFQLSFAAVLGLIAGYAACAGALRRLRGSGGAWRKLVHHAALLALTSLLAGSASLPFIAYHFNRVQLYSVIANMAAVPLTALLVMPAGLLGLLLMPLGLDRLALIPMGWGITLLLRVAHGIAALPAATIAAPHMPVASVVLLAVGLAFLCLWQGWARGLAVVPAAAGVIAWAMLRPPDFVLTANANALGARQPAALMVASRRGGDRFAQEIWQQYYDLPAVPFACDGPNRTDAVWACVPVAFSSAELAARGATAVFLKPSVRVVTDRDIRGHRPWVSLEPERRRAAIDLPFAPRDVLPPDDGARGD
jgi:competence protein ComEC